MIVYHGTGDYNLDGIMEDGPIFRTRCYVKGKTFCTTTDPAIAQLFAVRRTNWEDFVKGIITGIVLEFRLIGVTGKDYILVSDHRCLQNEKEVAVLNPTKLAVKAIWRNQDGKWIRSSRSSARTSKS